MHFFEYIDTYLTQLEYGLEHTTNISHTRVESLKLQIEDDGLRLVRAIDLFEKKLLHKKIEDLENYFNILTEKIALRHIGFYNLKWSSNKCNTEKKYFKDNQEIKTFLGILNEIIT